MPYQLPTFNIIVGIRHAVAASEWADPIPEVAQLRGTNKFLAGGSTGSPAGANVMYLLKLPAGTDIRDAGNFQFSDLVDVPGFEDPFVVVLVWDVAFGFPNEYRCASLTRTDPTVSGRFIKLPGQGDTPDRS